MALVAREIDPRVHRQLECNAKRLATESAGSEGAQVAYRGGRLTFAVHGQLSLWARSLISRWAGAVALPWRHEGVERPRSRGRLLHDKTRYAPWGGLACWRG